MADIVSVHVLGSLEKLAHNAANDILAKQLLLIGRGCSLAVSILLLGRP